MGVQLYTVSTPLASWLSLRSAEVRAEVYTPPLELAEVYASLELAQVGAEYEREQRHAHEHAVLHLLEVARARVCVEVGRDLVHPRERVEHHGLPLGLIRVRVRARARVRVRARVRARVSARVRARVRARARGQVRVRARVRGQG